MIHINTIFLLKITKATHSTYSVTTRSISGKDLLLLLLSVIQLSLVCPLTTYPRGGVELRRWVIDK